MLIDDLHRELSALGHEHARPLHGFTLQAITAGGITVSELARRTGVTKQAAAKTVAALERLDYVTRTPHPTDARATVIERTARGEELLNISAEVFGRLRAEWEAELGEQRVRVLEDDLRLVLARRGEARLIDFPGWLR